MTLLLNKHGTFFSLCVKVVNRKNNTNIPKNDNDSFDQDGFTYDSQTSRLLALSFLRKFYTESLSLMGIPPASVIMLFVFCVLFRLSLLFSVCNLPNWQAFIHCISIEQYCSHKERNVICEYKEWYLNVNGMGLE